MSNEMMKPMECPGCEEPECQECCDHSDELDHGICIDCGKDCTDTLIDQAVAHMERYDR